MIACVDLDGTITDAPEFYKALMAGLRTQGWEVHVVTGLKDSSTVTPGDVTEREGRLQACGCERGVDYDKLVVVGGPKKELAGAKVNYMRHVGASTLIDNRKQNVKAAQKAGYLGLRHKGIRAQAH